MKKKGFTTIELLAVIILLAVVMGIAIIGLNYVLDKGNYTFYQNIEQELLLSGSEYFNNHRELKPIGGSGEVKIEDLIADGYIEPIYDENGDKCTEGKVYIYVEDDNYKYVPCLENCGDYSSATTNELCEFIKDDDSPECRINLSDDKVIINNGAINYEIICQDKHFIDSNISTGDILLSNRIVELGSPTKSLNKNDEKEVYTYRGTITGITPGTTTFTLKEGSVIDGGQNNNERVEAPQTLTVYSAARDGVYNNNLIFNGSEQILISGGENVTYTCKDCVEGVSARNAGTYTIVITANGDSMFPDGKKTHEITVTIGKMKLTIPSQDGSLTYNKKSQSPSWKNNSSWLTASGTTSETNAGSYTVTFKINEPNNVQWSDGSTSDKNVTWKIAKANCTCSITNIPTINYPGNSVEVTYSCNGDGTKSLASSDANSISVSGNTLTPKKVASNITITAKQSAGTNYKACTNGTKVVNVNSSSYTLTVSAGDGTIPATSGWTVASGGKTATKSIDYNATYGTLPKPTREGYTFDGWYTEASGGTKVTKDTIIGAGDTTIYAHWILDKYKLKLTLGTGISKIYYKVNDANSYTSTTSSKEVDVNYGSTWYVYAEASTGYSYTATSSSSPKSGTMSTSGATFAPTGTVNTYTLKINAGDGTIPATSGWTVANGGKTATKKINYNATYGTLPKPTREGYTFDGWYTAASGGTKVSATTTIGASDTTIYAHWTVNSYNITYELNGGTQASTGVPTKYTYGTSTTINGKPSRSGYAFNGWCTASNLKECAFSQSISATAIGAKEFYAKWCQNCDEVSNGTCALDASEEGKCTYTTSCNSGYKISGNGTRNPTCTANTYTLKINAGDGTIPATSGWTVASGGKTATKDVVFNNKYGTLPKPTREGYTFDGWYTAASGGTKVSTTTTIGASDTTIYAHWILDKYKLTLTLGTGIGKIYYKVNGATSYSSTTSSTTVDVNYGSTWYAYAEASTGYSYTATSSSSPKSGTMSTSGATFAPTGTANKYKLTLTVGTGIGKIYYKINGATSYSSTTSSTTVDVNYGTTWYVYAEASTGYKYSATSSSSPTSGTMGTSGATFAPTAEKACSTDYTWVNTSFDSRGYSYSECINNWGGTHASNPFPTNPTIGQEYKQCKDYANEYHNSNCDTNYCYDKLVWTYGCPDDYVDVNDKTDNSCTSKIYAWVVKYTCADGYKSSFVGSSNFHSWDDAYRDMYNRCSSARSSFSSGIGGPCYVHGGSGSTEGCAVRCQGIK